MSIEDEIDKIIPIIKKYVESKHGVIVSRNNRNLSITRNIYSDKLLDLVIYDIKSIEYIYDSLNEKYFISIWTEQSSHIAIWEDGNIMASIN